MKNCPVCGAELRDGAGFCPMCGTKAEPDQQESGGSACEADQHTVTIDAGPSGAPGGSGMPPAYPEQAAAQEMSPVISTEEWLVTSLLLCVPVVNFIWLIYLAASSKINPSKRNWARGYLVAAAIGLMAAIYILSYLGRSV